MVRQHCSIATEVAVIFSCREILPRFRDPVVTVTPIQFTSPTSSNSILNETYTTTLARKVNRYLKQNLNPNSPRKNTKWPLQRSPAAASATPPTNPSQKSTSAPAAPNSPSPKSTQSSSSSKPYTWHPPTSNMSRQSSAQWPTKTKSNPSRPSIPKASGLKSSKRCSRRESWMLWCIV